MPRFPSKKQSLASKRNLDGNHGPKTAEGKAKSSQNGRRNCGTKTSKARARIIDARHGLNDDSLYAMAGCLTCNQHCEWPSFSNETTHSSLPLGCLEGVLQRTPSRCFYFLEGYCLADFREIRPDQADCGFFCVTDSLFLDTFGGKSSSRESRDRLELRFRKRMMRFISECKHYLRSVPTTTKQDLHPRMLNTLRQVNQVSTRCKNCRFSDGVCDLQDADISRLLSPENA